MRTLSEAFGPAEDERDFGFRLRNFLDEFYANPAACVFEDEPESLTARLRDGGLADAYLAALAEHLCRTRGWPAPGWTKSESRVLRRPFFATKTPRARAFLIQDSPTAFRARNIFIGKDALSRV